MERMERAGTQDGERPLPFEQAAESRDAYAEAVRACRLSPSAEAIALWIVEGGIKEALAGDRVMVVSLPTQRELARRLGLGLASICRGLKALEGDGVFFTRRRRRLEGVLNLSRVCVLAEARATDAEPAGFASGWRPRARGDPPPAAACSSAFHPVPPCSAPLRTETEKEAQAPPEYREPNRTETDSARAAQGGTPGTSGTSETGGTRRRPREIREGLSRLNRTAAWQGLQAGDFIGPQGRRRLPAGEKLEAARLAAVRLGLLRDDWDGQLQWLATVRDCALHADGPAGALAWRVASGKLHWANVESHDWAKSQLAAGAFSFAFTDS